MTDQRKPTVILATSASGGAISSAEVRLLQAFRLMDEHRRGNMQRIADGYVRDYPRRAASLLRLICGSSS
jgi:hypothetical protein